MWAEIEGLLGPTRASLRESEDRRSLGGGEGSEAVQSFGDTTGTVLHVEDDEVVASEANDLGESGGEAEEEEAVEGFATVEAGFEGFGRDGNGGGGRVGADIVREGEIRGGVSVGIGGFGFE